MNSPERKESLFFLPFLRKITQFYIQKVEKSISQLYFYNRNSQTYSGKIMTEDHQKKDTAQKKTEKEDLLPDISTGSFKEKFFLAGAFFLPVFLLAFLRMICWEIHGGEPGTDNFYHAAISLAGPEVFVSHSVVASFSYTETFYRQYLSLHLSGNVFCFNGCSGLDRTAERTENPFKADFYFCPAVLRKFLCLHIPFTDAAAPCFFHSLDIHLLFHSC